MKYSMECILDGALGVYLPQAFVQRFDADSWGITPEDVAILEAGPDHEEYWDAWAAVLEYAACTEWDGTVWHLYQDQDLFIVKNGFFEEDE